jgi:hypothetical protein
MQDFKDLGIGRYQLGNIMAANIKVNLINNSDEFSSATVDN